MNATTILNIIINKIVAIKIVGHTQIYLANITKWSATFHNKSEAKVWFNNCETQLINESNQNKRAFNIDKIYDNTDHTELKKDDNVLIKIEKYEVIQSNILMR